jgi:hypothetical protein
VSRGSRNFKPSFCSSSNSRSNSSRGILLRIDHSSISSRNYGPRINNWSSPLLLIVFDNKLKLSIIGAEGIIALFTLVEDGRALVNASCLNNIVFHLWMIAFRASLFDDHFALPPALAKPPSCLILMQPVFVLLDC